MVGGDGDDGGGRGVQFLRLRLRAGDLGHASGRIECADRRGAGELFLGGEIGHPGPGGVCDVFDWECGYCAACAAR